MLKNKSLMTFHDFLMHGKRQKNPNPFARFNNASVFWHMLMSFWCDSERGYDKRAAIISKTWSMTLNHKCSDEAQKLDHPDGHYFSSWKPYDYLVFPSIGSAWRRRGQTQEWPPVATCSIGSTLLCEQRHALLLELNEVNGRQQTLLWRWKQQREKTQHLPAKDVVSVCVVAWGDDVWRGLF